MKYYLKHYFNPYFDHLNLRPVPGVDGQTNRYNLGFTQNVCQGQILAEIVDLSQVESPIPRFILNSQTLPAGANTYINPDYPQYLLSKENGYVFYYEDKISVKRLLNVRSDVNFHTGNIFFVGDAMLHKDVKAGFIVQANNVLVQGLVEGGEVRARQDLQVLGGARGGAGKRCMLDAGNRLEISFAEKVELRSKHKLIVNKFCLHSKIYSAGEVLIHDQMAGGSCDAQNLVVVKGNLGNRAEIPTHISLGYDPFIVRTIEQYEKRLGALGDRIAGYRAVAGHLPPETNTVTRKLAIAKDKEQRLIHLRERLQQDLLDNPADLSKCHLIVLGVVFPGVRVNIGPESLVLHKAENCVYFSLTDQGIVVEPIPQKVMQYYA